MLLADDAVDAIETTMRKSDVESFMIAFYLMFDVLFESESDAHKYFDGWRRNLLDGEDVKLWNEDWIR